MATETALDELKALAVKENFDGMDQLYRLKGLATLHVGDDVRVLTKRLLNGGAKVLTNNGQECWTISEALGK
jgi:hypothetical protein